MPSYGPLSQPFHISDPVGLEDLSQILHDETCSVDDAVWNEEARTLLLSVRRQFYGGEEVEIDRGPDFIIYETSWLRSEVLIRNVNSWKKVEDQGIGDYTFHDWCLESGTLTIEFHQALNVVIKIDSLDITMVDVGFGGKAHMQRSKAGGSEVSSGKIF